MRISGIFGKVSGLPLLMFSLAQSDINTVINDDERVALAEAKNFYKEQPTASTALKRTSFNLPLLRTFSRLADPRFKPGKSARSDHIEWITNAFIRRIQKGNPIKLVDIFSMKEELAYFLNKNVQHELKKKGLPTTLESFETYKEFKALIRPLLDKSLSIKKVRQAHANGYIKDETSVLYDGPEGKIIIPHTSRSSRFWGKDTKLCVSGLEADKYFHWYNSEGPLLYYIPNPKSLCQDNKCIQSGKVLITQPNEVYDELDRGLNALPEHILPLHTAALQNMSPENRECLEILTEGIKLVDSSSCEYSHIAHLPAHQKAQLENMFSPVNSIIFERDPSLSKDKAFMLAAVKFGLNEVEETNALQFADKTLQADPEIVLAAVQEDGRALEFADKTLKADPKIVAAAIQQDGRALEFADETLRADPEIVSAAVQKNGSALEFADKTLKADPKIVAAAIQQDGRALEFADETLRADPKIVSAAVQKNGSALEFADETLKADPETVSAAVQKNGSALEFADETLRADPKIVSAAVQQDGRALEFADKTLKADPKIVAAAIQQDGRALEFADKTLKADPETVSAAVQKNGSALEFADETLRADPKIVSAAVQKNGSALEFADETLRADPKIVLAAIQQDGRALKFADETLRNNADFVLPILQNSICLLEYIDLRLLDNPEFVSKLCEIKESGDPEQREEIIRFLHRAPRFFANMGKVITTGKKNTSNAMVNEHDPMSAVA